MALVRSAPLTINATRSQSHSATQASVLTAQTMQNVTICTRVEQDIATVGLAKNAMTTSIAYYLTDPDVTCHRKHARAVQTT